jgi:hypothetical protein
MSADVAMVQITPQMELSGPAQGLIGAAVSVPWAPETPETRGMALRESAVLTPRVPQPRPHVQAGARAGAGAGAGLTPM